MDQFLIVYSSRYGQTAKISDHLAHTIRLKGYPVHVEDIEIQSNLSPKGFKGVLVGTPLYRSRYNTRVVQWVRKNKQELNQMTSGFFLVSLNAADKRPEAKINDQNLVQKFLSITDWVPSIMASFAGALVYPRYNFFIRFIMKRISKAAGEPVDTSRSHELTNWKQVDDFALRFLHACLDKPSSVPPVREKTYLY